MYGRVPQVARGPTEALRESHITAKSGKMGPMVGIGLAMEMMDTNILLYDLMLEHVWEVSVSSPSSALDDTTTWRRRYSLVSAAVFVRLPVRCEGSNAA